MRRDDATRLRHMLDAAREALSFVEGLRRDDFDANRQLVLALLKCIEIIGEAATHVSETIRRRAPSVPWADIVGMRNRLVHLYFDIDIDRVWHTETRDLPPLIAELARTV